MLRWLGVALGAALCFGGLAHAVPNEVPQEGLLTTAQGAPLEGQHDLRVRLYSGPIGGAPLFDELHRAVAVLDGYYAIRIGAVEALSGAVFAQPELYLGISVDGGPELAPRTRLGKVPAAFVADEALNVTGDITPRSIRVNGQEIVDPQGRWVGNPAGLVGPEGPAGPPGPPGPAGGDGAADTPAQVRAKLVQVDGAGSGVDADRLDGLDSSAFPRTGVAVRDLLRQADGAGSGVDADRLDGHDSAEFVRTAEQVRDRLRTVDGSGSGLDTDRLDGLDSAQFMRSDANTGTTGDLDVAGTLTGAQLRVAGNGRVGVGVADPAARVDVAGDVRAEGFQFIPQAGPPASPSAGMMYFDAGASALRVWDGTEWVTLGAGDGGGGAPVDPQVQAVVAAFMADGPSAYWKLDEQGGLQAADSSGSNRHGTYEGNVHRGAQGLIGRAVNIRSAGWVETPVNLSDLMPPDQGTVSAIIRLPDAYSNFGNQPHTALHHVWSSYAYWQGVSVGVVNGVGGVHFWGFYDGSNAYSVSFPIDPGQWVHVAWVHRDDRLYGYVNGVEVSVAAPNDQGNLGAFHIGHFHQAQHGVRTRSPEYPERIQHVAVYPLGLSADQIMAQVQAAGLAGPNGPMRSCKAIKDQFPQIESGVYSLDPDDAGPVAPFDAYCDMTTDGGGWTQVEYLTTDDEGTHNSYASVLSANPRGQLGNGSYKINTAALLGAATELRYSEPVGDPADGRTDDWDRDYACGLDATIKGKFTNPGNANQAPANIVCRNLETGAVAPNPRLVNYQQWSGCWVGPRLWIGSAASAPNYHGDYCDDCIVTWKCDNGTRGVYSTTTRRRDGTAAFWLR